MAHKRLDLGGQGCSLIRNRDRGDFEAQEPRPRQGSNSKEKHRKSKGMHRKSKEMHRKCIGNHRKSKGKHGNSKAMHRKVLQIIGKIRICIGKDE